MYHCQFIVKRIPHFELDKFMRNRLHSMVVNNLDLSMCTIHLQLTLVYQFMVAIGWFIHNYSEWLIRSCESEASSTWQHIFWTRSIHPRHNRRNRHIGSIQLDWRVENDRWSSQSICQQSMNLEKCWTWMKLNGEKKEERKINI